MYNFTTLFDKNYLPRGLALLESLERHLTQFNLYVLCLDEHVFAFFSENKNEHVILLKLSDLENSNTLLKEAKLNRSLVEYYFTLSPSLPLYILKHFPSIHSICSLDADIYFFSSPESIFKILDTKSIVITPHKFSEKLKNLNLEQFGLYNVSFQIFKNNNIGLRCLEDWQRECIKWCGDYFDKTNQRYADQKYLDKWIGAYPNQVHVLNDAVTGLAAWNIDNYAFTINNGKICVNGANELIFYHFHYFKLINSWLALNGFANYGVKNNSGILLDHIYLPYWKALNNCNLLVGDYADDSVRFSLKKSAFRLLITHKSGFLKKFNKLFKINVTLLHLIYIRLRKA